MTTIADDQLDLWSSATRSSAPATRRRPSRPTRRRGARCSGYCPGLEADGSCPHHWCDPVEPLPCGEKGKGW